MTAVVIDTNVGVVANRQHPPAGPKCILTCIQALRAAQSQLVLLDDDARILDEYRRYLSPSGQPGAGDAFFKWLWDNRANSERCQLVPLTPMSDDDEDFEEFPRDPELNGFDRSDRKFVAVALASGMNPEILNASDSDWWHFRRALQANGVNIAFLCPGLMPNDARRRE